MTVKELKEKLDDFADDAIVVVDACVDYPAVGEVTSLVKYDLPEGDGVFLACS